VSPSSAVEHNREWVVAEQSERGINSTLALSAYPATSSLGTRELYLLVSGELRLKSDAVLRREVDRLGSARGDSSSGGVVLKSSGDRRHGGVARVVGVSGLGE